MQYCGAQQLDEGLQASATVCPTNKGASDYIKEAVCTQESRGSMHSSSPISQPRCHPVTQQLSFQDFFLDDLLAAHFFNNKYTLDTHTLPRSRFVMLECKPASMNDSSLHSQVASFILLFEFV